ncbi:MAG: hypothetical protein HYX90_06470, partial [Chloroflexi bacterium]|nr:hypothetical protein [Chloroflexota bacterium]
HMFFAHLAPGIFPFNKSIFTGKMPAEKYAQEHPMEYERIIGARPVSDSGMPAVSGGAGEPQNTGGQGGSDKLNAIENSTWDTSGEGNASGERRMGLFKEALCLLKGDRLVQIGLVILILTAALVSFVSFSAFPLERPLFGLMLYLLLPLLWVVGAIVFILAILRH